MLLKVPPLLHFPEKVNPKPNRKNLLLYNYEKVVCNYLILIFIFSDENGHFYAHQYLILLRSFSFEKYLRLCIEKSGQFDAN